MILLNYFTSSLSSTLSVWCGRNLRVHLSIGCPRYTRDTPSSQQLKEILSGLSEGFQQTIADKILEEEAHKQYRVLVGKEKKGKTSDRRKLTEATVVTSETILMLRDERDRVDAAKAARQSKKSTPSWPASLNITSLPKLTSADTNVSALSPTPLRQTTPTSNTDEL